LEETALQISTFSKAWKNSFQALEKQFYFWQTGAALAIFELPSMRKMIEPQKTAENSKQRSTDDE